MAGIDVVVVAFGAPELLERCLATLGDTYPVLVVDNSSDAAVRAVAERHGAGYVDPGENLGFAGGVNLGLAKRERSTADVLLLNPDASITPEGVAQLASRLHATGDLAGVAPAQVDTEGRAARVGWPFPTPAGAWVEAIGLGSRRSRADFLIGSVLLIRSSALEEVGPFDEQFFLYAEETDWQQRARRLGWRVALCPEVVATHVGAGTGGDPDRREVRFHASQERYIRKYHGRRGWRVYRAGVMAGALLRALVLPGDRGRRRRPDSTSTGAARRRWRSGSGWRPMATVPGRGWGRCRSRSPTWWSPTPSPEWSATSAGWPTSWPAAATRSSPSGGTPCGCGPSWTTRSPSGRLRHCPGRPWRSDAGPAPTWCTST